MTLTLTLGCEVTGEVTVVVGAGALAIGVELLCERVECVGAVAGADLGD